MREDHDLSLAFGRPEDLPPSRITQAIDDASEDLARMNGLRLACFLTVSAIVGLAVLLLAAILWR